MIFLRLTKSEERGESEVGVLLTVQLQTVKLPRRLLDVVEGGEEELDPVQGDGVRLEAGLQVGGHPGEEGGEVHLVPALDEADQEEAGPGASEDGDLAGGEGVTCDSIIHIREGFKNSCSVS